MNTKSWLVFTLVIGFAVCGLIALPTPAVEAGCGYPSYSVPYYPSYPAPSYNYAPPVQVIEKVIEKEIAPVAVPVVVPATVFQYLPALTAQPVAAAPAATPCAQAQAVTPCQAAAVQQTAAVATQATQQVTQTTGQATVAQTQAIDQLIKARLAIILKQYTEQQPQQPASNYGTGSIDYPDGPPPLMVDSPASQSPTQAPVEQPQTQQVQPQQQPQSTNNVSQQDIMNRWAVSLHNNCAECHTQGQRTSGGVQIFAANGQYSPNVPASQILDAIRSGRMPKNRKLTDVDRMTLLSVQPG